ncbi:MAG: sulfotransferase family protein [Bacteroidota bacterium]
MNFFCTTNIEKIKKIPIHFIFCTERTGSSMLTTMLNINKEVLCTSEELFSLYFYRRYKDKNKWSEKEISKFCIDLKLLMENSPEIYFSDFKTLQNNLTAFKENLDFQLLIRIIYLHFIENKNKEEIKVIVDKQIKFLFHLETVKEIFPESKIIVLTRDIRDNVISKSRRKINSNSNLLFHAGTWNETYKNVARLFELYPNKIFILHYEKLVTETEKTLINICSQLGVEFHKEMIEFNRYFSDFIELKSDEKNKSELSEIKVFHESMFKPVDSKLAGQWEQKLDKKTAIKIATVGYETGLKLGYDFGKPYGLSILNPVELKQIYKAYNNTTRLFNFYLKMPLGLKLFIKRSKRNLIKQETK